MKSSSRVETARPASAERTKSRPRRKKRSGSAVRRVPVSATGTVGRKYPGSGKQPGHEPPEHFHVNMSEIPFVTGKVMKNVLHIVCVMFVFCLLMLFT